jgi:eukaryotic-like serine/threonine-protein kinase
MPGAKFLQHSAFPDPGDLFDGRYRILEAIGKGGFAQVYHARQEDLDRDVAIKILTPGSDDPEPRYAEVLIKRFHQEARLVSKLRDPHTITMYDYGQSDTGLLYLVLEFVKGASLSQVIRSQAPLAPDRVFRILSQTLQSLREAHDLGVLHRDIKPANIMLYEHLGKRDNVKLLDFGIAKVYDEARGTVHDLTADGVLLGTANYMAPEQILGRAMIPASDLYSLGLVAYELVVGRRANDEPSTMDVISRQIDPEPFALPETMSIHIGLRKFINKMIAKPLEERYASAEEALIDLEETLQQGDRTAVATLDMPLPDGIAPSDEIPGDEDKTWAFEGRPGQLWENLPEVAVEVDEVPAPEPSQSHLRLQVDDVPTSPGREYRSKPFTAPVSLNGDLDSSLTSVGNGSRSLTLALAIVAGVAVLVVAVVWMTAGSRGGDARATPDTGAVHATSEPTLTGRQEPSAPPERPVPSSILEITTAPPGLSVYVDDKLAGLSPVEIDMHGFTFPSTISARLNPTTTRTVVLTRPAPFVHLDFTNVAPTQAQDTPAPAVASPLPRHTETVSVVAPAADIPAAVVQNEAPPRTAPAVQANPSPSSTARSTPPAGPGRDKGATRPTRAPETARAEEPPASEPVKPPEPARPAEPAPSSGFNLPALDNLE